MDTSKLVKKLEELNNRFNTNSTIEFNSNHGSMYSNSKRKIIIDLKDSNLNWTLHHEFKHHLQNGNHLYQSSKNIGKKYRRNVVISRWISLLLSLSLFVYSAFAMDIFSKDLHLHLIFSYSFILVSAVFLFIGFNIVCFSERRYLALLKKINHHFEYQCDLFASQETGEILDECNFSHAEDSRTHPSAKKRVAFVKRKLEGLNSNSISG